MWHTIAHHYDFSTLHCVNNKEVAGLTSPSVWISPNPVILLGIFAPPSPSQGTHCEWWRGLKKWPNVWQCRWRRRGSGGDYVWHVGGSHLCSAAECRQIKRTKRTPEDASLSFERAAATAPSPLSCIPRKTATQRLLPRAQLARR